MKVRWKELVIALILAIGLWYSLSASEKVESQFEVRVDYKGIPASCVVKSGLVNKVNIRIRASAGQLRSMIGREFSCSIDLAHITKGANFISITPDKFSFQRGIEIVDIEPSILTLMVDTLETKAVPLAIIYDETNEFSQRIVAEPVLKEVTVSGPSEQLATLKGLSIDFATAQKLPLGASTTVRTIPTPSGITVTPSEAVISLNTSLIRQEVQAKITLPSPEVGSHGVTLFPKKVTITASTPQHLVSTFHNNPQVSAKLILEETAPGTYVVPVQISLPEQTDLIKVEPKTVTVIIQDKQTTPAR